MENRATRGSEDPTNCRSITESGRTMLAETHESISVSVAEVRLRIALGMTSSGAVVGTQNLRLAYHQTSFDDMQIHVKNRWFLQSY
jgi:hypothetical protein